MVTYPETAFGGEFETAADYRDPYLQKLIAEKGGSMYWPLIRYSYDTHNLDLPTPAPSPPTWRLTEAQCEAVVKKKGLKSCRDLEFNWLGTDDQGRDVVARLIYGFRISVLFGLTLTIISSVIGIVAGAVQGYFGGWTDLLFQRVIEIWTSVPSLYLLLIISSVLVPGFFVLLGILLLFSWVSLVGLVRAEFLRGRNFEYIQAARALGVSNAKIMFRHLAAQRDGGDADLPAVHPLVVRHDADRARLPRLRAAARFTLARRIAVARQGQHPGAVARPCRLFLRRHHAIAADLHRRSGARRLRPAQDVPVSAMTEPLLTVQDLSIAFHQGGHSTLAVDRISFDIKKGETLALVGESGSGKSTTALSVLKLLPYPACSHPSGRITFKGKDLLNLTENDIRHVRGNDITIIFQEPMTSLNPLHTIERQIGEILDIHQGVTGAAARARTLELLGQVGIPDPEGRLKSYPHQMSGGQRQRVMIAMALANEPDLLIADEPTTALDVTVQAQILKLLKEIQQRHGMAMLYITHDLGIVRKISDRVCVMSKGKIVEQGPVERVYTAPEHPYTRALLAAEPKGVAPPINERAPTVIKTDDLKIWFPIKRGLMRKTVGHIKAVDGVSVEVREGETLGVVGESGSGKTTLGLAIMRLISSEGPIVFMGKNVNGLQFKEMRPFRKNMQMVFQDPYGSLSPRMSVSDIIQEGLGVHFPDMKPAERERRVLAALNDVNLDAETRHRYPHEFSGGQRQRIAIARAIVLEPNFIVLDEPTSALDMLIQAQIVDLLRDIQKRRKLTYLFISHDLKVVAALASRLVVMRHGKVVESGAASEVFKNPKTDYTRALFAAAFSLEAATGEVVAQ